VLDVEGTWVAATSSINSFFGSGFVVPGTGVLLNNTLADFNFEDPSSPNAVGPDKRPVSHMSPTAIENNDMLALLSSPGGNRIPSIIAVALNDALNNKNINDWVKTPRYHLVFHDNVIEHEPDAFYIMSKIILSSKGHTFKPFERSWDRVPNTFGNLQAIAWYKKSNEVNAASDPRQLGEALVERTQAPES